MIMVVLEHVVKRSQVHLRQVAVVIYNTDGDIRIVPVALGQGADRVRRTDMRGGQRLRGNDALAAHGELECALDVAIRVDDGDRRPGFKRLVDLRPGRVERGKRRIEHDPPVLNTGSLHSKRPCF